MFDNMLLRGFDDRMVCNILVSRILATFLYNLFEFLFLSFALI